jgi:hypothetical protein
MKTALSLAPCLCFVLALACGDSGSGGSGGEGTGNGPSTGGNGGNGSGAGIQGGGPSVGGSSTGGSAPLEPCPSAVSDVPQKECDLYLQDCPNGGTCDVVNGDTTGKTYMPVSGCIEQNGLKGIGESCGASPECEAKLTCVGNRCSTFCCKENLDSCGGGTCSVEVSLQDSKGIDSGFSFQGCAFSPTCDLFTPDSCPENENCYLASEGVLGCYQAQDRIPDGGACAFLNDCLDSSVCLGPQDEGICYYLCLVGSAEAPGLGGCPVGKECKTNLATGFEDIGYCDVP